MNKFTSNLSKIRNLASTSEKKQAKTNDSLSPEKKNLTDIISPRSVTPAKPRALDRRPTASDSSSEQITSPEVISPRIFVAAKPRVPNRESAASESDQSKTCNSEEESDEHLEKSTTTSSDSYEPLVPRDKPLVRRDDVDQPPSGQPLAHVIPARKEFALATPSAPRQERARFELTRNPTSVKRAKKIEHLKNKRGAFASAKRDARANAVFRKPEITSIRKILPMGMNIDINGNVSGQHTFTHHPMDGQQYAGKPVEEVIQSKQTNELKKIASIGGVSVADFATRDFYRLNYDIPTNGGQANPLAWPSDEQITQRAALKLKPGTIPTRSDVKAAKEELRSEQIAHALRNFVQNDDADLKDNDNVAFVLSSVMLQHIPTELQCMVYGLHLPYRALALNTANDNDGKVRPLTIKDSSGQEQPVTVKGLGDATFALSRDGDNFKLTFDQPTYAEARFGQEHLFPLHKEGVIGIRLKTELIVDGKKARNGELALTMPNGIQAEYSGRFKLN